MKFLNTYPSAIVELWQKVCSSKSQFPPEVNFLEWSLLFVKLFACLPHPEKQSPVSSMHIFLAKELFQIVCSIFEFLHQVQSMLKARSNRSKAPWTHDLYLQFSTFLENSPLSCSNKGKIEKKIYSVHSKKSISKSAILNGQFALWEAE